MPIPLPTLPNLTLVASNYRSTPAPNLSKLVISSPESPALSLANDLQILVLIRPSAGRAIHHLVMALLAHEKTKHPEWFERA
jgi:hypothetical protein